MKHVDCNLLIFLTSITALTFFTEEQTIRDLGGCGINPSPPPKKNARENNNKSPIGLLAHEELMHKPFSNLKATCKSLINIPE